MKNRSLLGVFCCIFIIACGSSATQVAVTLPNGQQGASIQCTEISGCYESAGKACPIGYKVIERSSKTVMEVPSVAQFAYNFCKGQKQQNPKATCDDTPPQPIAVERTTMLIQCGSSSESSEGGSAQTKEEESDASEPASIAPKTEDSCSVLGSGVKRKLYMHATQKGCPLPENDAVLDEQFPPIKREGESFTLGELKCSMGKRKKHNEYCVAVWTCDTPDERSAVFGLKLDREDQGEFRVMMSVSETEICETKYSVSPNP